MTEPVTLRVKTLTVDLHLGYPGMTAQPNELKLCLSH